MKANPNKHLNEYNHFKKNLIKLNKTKNLFSYAHKSKSERETHNNKGNQIIKLIKIPINIILSFYPKGIFLSLKLEPSLSNREILSTMEKEIITKQNINIKGDYINNATQNKMMPKNNKFIEIESPHNKNNYNSKEKINRNVIFPQIVINNNRSLTKLNNNIINYNDLNDRDKENSTFQETLSIDLIEKSGIYNTVKSEKSMRSMNNNYNNLNYNSNYNRSSSKRGKKQFNLYTNSNRGYNLANNNNNLNQMGNTFITFSNEKLKMDYNLQQQENKNSPIFSKEFQANKNEERLIKKVNESNLNTTSNVNTDVNINNNDKNNEKANVSFTASNKREIEKVIIKEKKDANDPLLSKQYYKISSFENKLNVELAKLSRNYGKIEARGKFSNDLLEKYIDIIPDFDKYRIVKLLNNKENYKFKLLPMVINKKNGFEKLGRKFFDNLKYTDPEYYDINKEWKEYLTKVKDSKIEEENTKNSINFDFSKDYKKSYEEEQSNLDDYNNSVKPSQAGISSNKFFDSRNLDINKDKETDINKISVEKYNENEEEYKLI